MRFFVLARPLRHAADANPWHAVHAGTDFGIVDARSSAISFFDPKTETQVVAASALNAETLARFESELADALVFSHSPTR